MTTTHHPPTPARAAHDRPRSTPTGAEPARPRPDTGRRVRDLLAAADRIPRETWDAGRGAWTPNPARRPARTRAENAIWALAAALREPVLHLGPCGACRTWHHRYGPGGAPLCPECRGGAA